MRVELPILSFICLALLVALIPLHFKSRNVAILSIIFWLLAGNIIQGVNSIIWARDAHVRGTPWCDIATKLLLATRVALPAACACICRHLYILSSSLEPKRRPHRTAFECSICFVFPLLYMAFHTLVQPRRFDLISSFGCLPSIYVSVPALILVWLPILVFCVTTIFYSALALNSHIRRSAGPSDDGRFPSQLVNLTFLRPLLQSVTISTFILSATVFAMYVHIKMSGGLLPWKSWSQVH
ncbi:putative pheromone receptor STE3.3, partial [Abortiporus biennis]